MNANSPATVTPNTESTLNFWNGVAGAVAGWVAASFLLFLFRVWAGGQSFSAPATH